MLRVLPQITSFMGPTWVLSAPDGPHVGAMNLVIRENGILPSATRLESRYLKTHRENLRESHLQGSCNGSTMTRGYQDNTPGNSHHGIRFSMNSHQIPQGLILEDEMPFSSFVSYATITKYIPQNLWDMIFIYAFISDKFHIDGSLQDCSNPIAIELELLQSCTNSSICR